MVLDDRTHKELCAPFADAVYQVDEAYDVVPAHPNCRCAMAPYFGDEEPLETGLILRNG